jgi:predicted nucleic acid-binding protein
MQKEYNVVIADTTCFILLDKIGKLDLLKLLFSNICTTKQIASEFGKPLPNWVIIQTLKDHHYIEILEVEVDLGEASAIALYFEIENSLLILDDYKARKLARKLGINFTGTFGVLLKAKEKGLITAIKPILALIQKTNFRFSEAVLHSILSEANELE